MSVIVTGGAGYIGSHIVKKLEKIGESPIVIDDLSEGHQEAVGKSRLIVGDFSDHEILNMAMEGIDPPFVIHMAASCQVGESVANPSKYYENNLIRSLKMLSFCAERRIRGIIFSSTAAVYGEPKEIPIKEDHATLPVNPYGETKLAFEKALEWHRRSHGIGYVSLRYFNAAGADPDGELGEDHKVETHLIPRLLLAAMTKIDCIEVYGNDYPTFDGTCIRDYIHVSDLAEAHILAMDLLERKKSVGEVYNIGNGEGFSVHEVIEVARIVTGRKISVKMGKKRDGDPAVLVASSKKISEALGWKPKYSSLDDIIESAWRWQKEHPEGYRTDPLC